MDKQKQIEEMARIMCSGCICNETMTCSFTPKEIPCDFAKNFAEALYNAGYRKISENEVVLTREEFEVYEFVKKKHASNEEVRSSEIVQGILHHIKTVRKETAEKFAELLKIEFKEEDFWCDFVAWKIDEICKEITEG